jgi:hypothetical protein
MERLETGPPGGRSPAVGQNLSYAPEESGARGWSGTWAAAYLRHRKTLGPSGGGFRRGTSLTASQLERLAGHPAARPRALLPRAGRNPVSGRARPP